MKILTKEEEAAHSTATWKGGLLGGAAGIAVGVGGVYAASLRFPAFRHLSLPFRAFLVTGTTSFAAVTSADRASHSFEKKRHADTDYQNASERDASMLASTLSVSQKFKNLVSEQRYTIVSGSWVLSMLTAFALVSRSRHLTGQQKLVQARVYAQGLTLAVLVASFALEGNDLREGKGRWETVKVVDPDDPTGQHLIEKRVHHEAYQGEDQWMDMIESQERKMRSKGEEVREHKEKKKEEKNQEEEGKEETGKHEGDDQVDNGEHKEGKAQDARKEKAKQAGKAASSTASAPSKDRQKEVHKDKSRSDGAGRG